MDDAEKIPLPPSSYDGSLSDSDHKWCTCYYCDKYYPTFVAIMSKNPMWLTVSPRADDRDPTVAYKEWLNTFDKFRACSHYILGVVEFANYRMHFHILYSCKDEIKSYKLVNKIRTYSMVKIYRGGPKKGLHYLFKDIEDAQTLIPNDDVIFTVETLIEYREKRKQQIKKMLEQNELDIGVKTVPKYLCKFE